MKTTTTKGALSALSLAALGVVYGDIGTSPLYGSKKSSLLRSIDIEPFSMPELVGLLEATSSD